MIEAAKMLMYVCFVTIVVLQIVYRFDATIFVLSMALVVWFRIYLSHLSNKR